MAMGDNVRKHVKSTCNKVLFKIVMKMVPYVAKNAYKINYRTRISEINQLQPGVYRIHKPKKVTICFSQSIGQNDRQAYLQNDPVKLQGVW